VRQPAAAALQAAGATVVAQEAPGVAGALATLLRFDLQSLLVEGGALLHGALWDAGVVDYVQLYETETRLGPRGVALARSRTLLADDLIDRQVTALGPDTLIEGYVHRPH